MMHLPSTLSMLQYPEFIQQNLHSVFKGGEKKRAYVGDHPILPHSAERQKSGVITWLTIDARAAHKGEKRAGFNLSQECIFICVFVV